MVVVWYIGYGKWISIFIQLNTMKKKQQQQSNYKLTKFS